MSGHDDVMLENVALLALDALHAGECAPVRAHLSECETCRREYARTREMAAALSIAPSAQPVEPSPLLRGRILRAAEPARARAPRTPSSWLAAVAAACLIAAAALGALYVATLNRLHTERAVLADVTAPGTVRYQVHGGEVLRSGSRLYIAMNVPAPPNGKVYQAWTLPRGSKTMAPSVTFTTARGRALVHLPVDADRIVAVAVSVEPSGGSRQPTSVPVFVQKLAR